MKIKLSQLINKLANTPKEEIDQLKANILTEFTNNDGHRSLKSRHSTPSEKSIHHYILDTGKIAFRAFTQTHMIDMKLYDDLEEVKKFGNYKVLKRTLLPKNMIDCGGRVTSLSEDGKFARLDPSASTKFSGLLNVETMIFK